MLKHLQKMHLLNKKYKVGDGILDVPQLQIL